ncbi:BTB/POZ domain-containing protein 19 [Spea bombifrons]|uniref:BTB/POZ domain-containing protein 19 n=1 Tax=Spea bombifrons TaxID=233779 RepID=UPI00234ACB01|nr:BTB/POZ domain-containing protein 19 [Spea bombifrons]
MAHSAAKAKLGSPATLLGDNSCLPAALRGLINDPQFSDVTFVVGKERQVVHAHRCILACRCKVFQGMFSKQLQAAKSSQELQVPFVLADMHPEVFLAVMEFLYTNSVTLNNVIALEVLTSAVEYGLDDLRKLCVEFISKTLTVELACEALQAAVTYGQSDLRKKCLSYIERHTVEVIKTQSFRELSDLGLQSVLQSNRLTIDEVPLIQAVREWAHVSSVVLDLPISVVAMDVVRELRLFLLSPDELTALERENRKDELIPESQIAQAWKFHALKKVSEIQPHLFHRRKGTIVREHHRYLETPSK